MATALRKIVMGSFPALQHAGHPVQRTLRIAPLRDLWYAERC